MNDTLGLYISIPFCRAKCTFCNFASDAFDPGLLPLYVEAMCAEILNAPVRAGHFDADMPALVDSIYLGGGTPSLLSAAQVTRLFAALRAKFTIASTAEITVECAPGQLSDDSLSALQSEGMNRVSFGVQSFVDRESAAVGRRHTGAECRQEIERVLNAGVRSVNVDLIAGLPHQTQASWSHSLHQLMASGADHASVYLFEVDEDSRLGREVLSDGSRYAATAVPNDDLMAELYEVACSMLPHDGLAQYEISNFARVGGQSNHNLKYWQRKPYLGFGLDAHSMLRAKSGTAVRFANGEELGGYLCRPVPSSAAADGLALFPKESKVSCTPQALSTQEAVEEMLFLGLRINAGIDLAELASSDPQVTRKEFRLALESLTPVLEDACEQQLLIREGTRIRLTNRGRLLSNELFSRLLLTTSNV